MKLRVATRTSKLALAQTRWVIKQLQLHHAGLEVEEFPIVTRGDKEQDKPLWQIGGKALFVSELEQAVLRGEADFAVHSMKDLPAEIADGLDIVCIPPREDPSDAIVSFEGEEFDALTAGSSIGTSSPRRTVQLRAKRPDLAFVPLRGNIDTRIRKLDSGEVSAIVLALAGLRRLGIQDKRIRVLPFDLSLPAIGQGALALQGRTDDTGTTEILSCLENSTARLEIEAERALAKGLGVDCHVPVAGLARSMSNGQQLKIEAMVASSDGDRTLSSFTQEDILVATQEQRYNEARRMGTELAERLLEQGAKDLIT
ncbi:MAG: hydroxymethylbilane synthase [Myxococcales bacterium]|nr:MAG: hydroxymethylbilane synthase [Myxococcales bacterium]